MVWVYFLLILALVLCVYPRAKTEWIYALWAVALVLALAIWIHHFSPFEGIYL